MRVKIGDRVKVEFEGVVTDIHPLNGVPGVGIQVNGRWYKAEDVTALPPQEPTGLGAVVRVTYGHENEDTFVRTSAVARTYPWFNEDGTFTWSDILGESEHIEILSEGYHAP